MEKVKHINHKIFSDGGTLEASDWNDLVTDMNNIKDKVNDLVDAKNDSPTFTVDEFGNLIIKIGDKFYQLREMKTENTEE